MMPSCDPRDIFVYPYLKNMKDSFFARLNVAKLDFHNIYILNTAISSAIL